MKKITLSIISIIAFAFTISAQNVNIPDAKFKAYLLANTSINTDADKLNISVAEAVAYNGLIDVWNRGITSLVGIEAFTKLSQLDCSQNNLKNLDVTKNTSLNWLDCYSNQLTSLDITKNIALTYYNCGNNQLTSLDVTKNTALTWLACPSNQLTSLDVTKNTALFIINCTHNQLISLDVTKITTLIYLHCSNNRLTSLDVTKNTALTRILCASNQLTSLDVTKNTVLTQLDCVSNPKLTCIEALNSQVKTSWYKDESAQYNENCNYVKNVYIPDAKFKAYLLANKSINTDADISEISVAEASNFTGAINVPKLNIESLIGIEAFTKITYLNCSSNILAKIDVSKNTSLTSLLCYSNKLTNLDVSKNTALTMLLCHLTQLSSLDV